jgi:hypothetical protein
MHGRSAQLNRLEYIFVPKKPGNACSMSQYLSYYVFMTEHGKKDNSGYTHQHLLS